jgi:putative ABC transport system ATP-binding protein
MAVLSLLREISKQDGCTVVMVTHSDEAAEYGDRRIYLRDGRVEKESA